MSAERPWDRADTDVDEGVARAALAQFPALDAADIAYLHEGWDSRAFVVGGEWIFRLPKRRPMHERLGVEIALLPHLSPLLPASIPRFTYIGEPHGGYPYRFVGYRRLAGQIAQQLNEARPAALDLPALGAAVGRFLAALHRFPIDEARGLGVRPDCFHDNLARLAEEARRLLNANAPHVSAEERDRAADMLALPASFAGQPCLIHNDLACEHLLVEPPAALLGVIDWGDVAIGDPALDFAGAYYLGGAPALGAAMIAAGRQGDVELAVRARFHAICRAVEDVNYGLGDNRPDYLHAGRRVLRFPEQLI
jgi:aminoglycoside phosphotransferase (APT) family kinase protein